jgi:hypothetical protein
LFALFQPDTPSAGTPTKTVYTLTVDVAYSLRQVLVTVKDGTAVVGTAKYALTGSEILTGTKFCAYSAQIGAGIGYSCTGIGSLKFYSLQGN